jgi:hypothetical protein
MPAIIGVLFLISCGGGDGAITGTAGAPNNNTFTTADSIVPASAFTATLTSAQEVPPTVSIATGTGVVIADPATRNFKATITTSGIAGTAAHIHLGVPGVSGAIVFPMTEIAAGSGVWVTQGTMADTQFNTLVAGNYYFNVHSAAFQNGEIRGQILAQLAALPGTGASTTGTGTTGFVTGAATAGTTSAANFTTFVNVLTGTQEVPSTSSTATAISIAILDRATKTLTATITAMGINGIAAHAHDAAAAGNAPIVFVLGETLAGSGIWVAKLLATDTQISALLAGNYFFDIHTAAFPNGEIRGQIVPVAGTGITGTGITGTGITGTGITGTGITGTGITGTGVTGTGATGTGTTGNATTAIGATGAGTTASVAPPGFAVTR